MKRVSAIGLALCRKSSQRFVDVFSEKAVRKIYAPIWSEILPNWDTKRSSPIIAQLWVSPSDGSSVVFVSLPHP